MAWEDGVVGGEEREAVADVDVDAGRGEEHGYMREIQLGDANDGLGQAEDDLLDERVLEHLAHNPTVAAADDEHFLWVRVARHINAVDTRSTRNSQELVALDALDNAIEDEHVAGCLRREDEDVLELALLDVEDMEHLEHYRLGPLRRDLVEPAICGWYNNFEFQPPAQSMGKQPLRTAQSPTFTRYDYCTKSRQPRRSLNPLYAVQGQDGGRTHPMKRDAAEKLVQAGVDLFKSLQAENSSKGAY
ncbi:hypothetical protein K439DRAFT_1625700 [Ramaria rubella]|nr:hypothetical protein K439DRAFT_1625700 [Ramaria rubella]